MSADGTFTSADRKKLFLELASRAGGITPMEVHREATSKGDVATEEAYYNIARRLAHRGVVSELETAGVRRYAVKSGDDGKWLDEDDLWELVDPDYPLLALTIANESARQMGEVPEHVWVALRRALESQPARVLFGDAIVAYCRDFEDQVATLADIDNERSDENRGRRSREAEVTMMMLVTMCKYGLGLSGDAISFPITLESAVATHKRGKPAIKLDEEILRTELKRRVADEMMVLPVNDARPTRPMLIGAVDGSTRGGVLSFLGEEGESVSGHAPLVSINTAVGQVNRDQKIGERSVPVFLRLPEKPEDMQRDDNRFTVMAKMMYPDLSDGKYMHAVWNAMDLIESKAALKLLRSWTTPKTHLEVGAADVVLKDGDVAPQDRDFSHYSQFDTYGRIVRNAIQVYWDIALSCKENGQTLGGVVKNAQLTVVGPVINWFAARLAARGELADVQMWPMAAMNLLPDQVIVTHLLTSGRKQGDTWMRTCMTVRPFHATTNFALTYRRCNCPSDMVMDKRERDLKEMASGFLDAGKEHFWNSFFRGENDPFVKMLDRVSYAAFYLAPVPHLDVKKKIPRVEFIVNATNRDADAMDWGQVEEHRARLCSALRQNGFDVSNEHSMFDSKSKLDILPSLLIRAHDTVKHWATDLLSRVQEFIGFYVARYVKTKRASGLTVRPLKRAEFRLLYESLKQERELHAGAEPPPTLGADNGDPMLDDPTSAGELPP